MDPENSNCIIFNLKHFEPRLSHQLQFQVNTRVRGRTIHHTIIDEGASTCVMFLSCWRVIGSPNLNQSPTTLKAFDDRVLKPYRILNSLIVELGGKVVSIDVEVIDAPLNYNLLLGRSCSMR